MPCVAGLLVGWVGAPTADGIDDCRFIMPFAGGLPIFFGGSSFEKKFGKIRTRKVRAPWRMGIWQRPSVTSRNRFWLEQLSLRGPTQDSAS